MKFTNSNNVSSYRLQSRMAKVATLAVANDENDSNTEYSPEKLQFLQMFMQVLLSRISSFYIYGLVCNL